MTQHNHSIYICYSLYDRVDWKTGQNRRNVSIMFIVHNVQMQAKREPSDHIQTTLLFREGKQVFLWPPFESAIISKELTETTKVDQETTMTTNEEEVDQKETGSEKIKDGEILVFCVYKLIFMGEGPSRYRKCNS